MEVYEKIRAEIMSGARKLDEKLACEDDLALKYHVSRITVKRALELLKEDGFIERVQGKGTFVKAVRPKEAEPPEKETASRNLVGMVLEHVASPYGLRMLYQMDQLLCARGYTLLTRFSYGDIEKETQEINTLLSMGIRALIIMPCHNSYYNVSILKLILKKFPVILVDKRMYGLPIPCVCTDGTDAVFRLMEHLGQRGSKSAALVTIDPSSTTSLGDRVNGFYKGLQKAEMLCAGECILPKRQENLLSTEQDEDYIARIYRFLDSFDALPDAFVLTEYALARLFYIVCAGRGLTIGKQVKACCIDEDDLASSGFLFTHMRQDEDAIAARVVDIFARLTAGEAVSPEPVQVSAIFRQGRST